MSTISAIGRCLAYLATFAIIGVGIAQGWDPMTCGVVLAVVVLVLYMTMADR